MPVVYPHATVGGLPELVAAPTLRLRRSGEVTLDRRPVVPLDVARQLATLQSNDRLLHPDRPARAPGAILNFECEAERTAMMTPFLRQAYRAGQRRLDAIVATETALFGADELAALPMALVPRSEASGSIDLDVADLSCEALVARASALRHAGLPVEIVVGDFDWEGELRE